MIDSNISAMKNSVEKTYKDFLQTITTDGFLKSLGTANFYLAFLKSEYLTWALEFKVTFVL